MWNYIKKLNSAFQRIFFSNMHACHQLMYDFYSIFNSLLGSPENIFTSSNLFITCNFFSRWMVPILNVYNYINLSLFCFSWPDLVWRRKLSLLSNCEWKKSDPKRLSTICFFGAVSERQYFKNAHTTRFIHSIIVQKCSVFFISIVNSTEENSTLLTARLSDSL